MPCPQGPHDVIRAFQSGQGTGKPAQSSFQLIYWVACIVLGAGDPKVTEMWLVFLGPSLTLYAIAQHHFE